MSTCYQIIIEMVRDEPLPEQKLEDLAEVVLDTLNRKTRLVALGPVVSVDFDRTAVEVEFTVGGDSAEAVNEKVARVSRVVEAALRAHDGDDDFAYNRSRVERVAATA